ncbi:hypothetical protein [Streptomyces sp. NPDC093707]|uniref:hypothetical protein n=1 Tax=Streptomyces sp. NPDC093707 TaxID=3154984 RepID=UPI00344D6270
MATTRGLTRPTRTGKPRKAAIAALLAALAVLGPMGIQPAAATEGDWQLLGDPHARTPDTPVGIDTGSVMRGEDNRIWWSPGGADPMRPIPGDWRTSDAPAAVVHNNRLFVFIRGNDHRLYYAQLIDTVNNRWTSWTGVPQSNALGTPAVVSIGGQLSVFYTNNNHQIVWSLYHSSAPTGWEFLNRALPGNARSNSSPAAVAYAPGRENLAVFYRGTDNHIYRQNYYGASELWDNRWTRVGGAITHSRPAAAVSGSLSDTIVLAVRGEDNYPWVTTIEAGRTTSDWHPVRGAQLTTHAPSLWTTFRASIYLAISAATQIGRDIPLYKRVN